MAFFFPPMPWDQKRLMVVVVMIEMCQPLSGTQGQMSDCTSLTWISEIEFDKHMHQHGEEFLGKEKC